MNRPRCIIYLLILVSSVCVVLCSCGSNEEERTTPTGPETTELEVMEYRALVYANAEVVNERYGGTKKFNQGLQGLFYNVTRSGIIVVISLNITFSSFRRD
jgi:hypothetical protein